MVSSEEELVAIDIWHELGSARQDWSRNTYNLQSVKGCLLIGTSLEDNFLLTGAEGQ